MSQEKKETKEKPNKDPFLRLKHIAYHMACPSPGEDTGLEEFVQFAKFQISLDKGILFWDKVWEDYTDEQILTEYYAILMSKDKKFKQECELLFHEDMFSGDRFEEDIAWMDEMIQQNQEEMGNKKEEESDEFDETPESLGE